MNYELYSLRADAGLAPSPCMPCSFATSMNQHHLNPFFLHSDTVAKRDRTGHGRSRTVELVLFHACTGLAAVSHYKPLRLSWLRLRWSVLCSGRHVTMTYCAFFNIIRFWHKKTNWSIHQTQLVSISLLSTADMGNFSRLWLNLGPIREVELGQKRNNVPVWFGWCSSCYKNQLYFSWSSHLLLRDVHW